MIGALVSACVDSNVVPCEDGTVCPEDTTCNVALGICVSKQQAAACEGVDDGSVCDVTAADEVCVQGVCLPSLCGDGIEAPDEACDDSNQVGGDGCSAKCDSTEICGNSVVDLALGEDCDDGNRLDHDGCSSTCGTEVPQWSRRPLSPSARYRAGMAYDSDRNRIVLVGGRKPVLAATGVYTLAAEDWLEWDGRWREMRTLPPSPKEFTALAYDTARKRTVFFGVTNATPPRTETWEYDGQSWTLVSTVGPPRYDAAFAFDPVRKRVYLQGGYDLTTTNGIPASDMWSWDGTTWSSVTLPTGTTLTSPREGASLAFDYKRGTLLLFGGKTSNGVSQSLMNDLWQFDGTTWTNRTANGATGTNIPTGRMAASMAWNGTCNCIVLFGGQSSLLNGGTVSNDTYTWNGSAWAKITATAGSPPTARWYGTMTYDGYGRSVLIGGVNAIFPSSQATAYIEETWIFDGAVWKQDRARYRGASAYDVDRNRVVVYGPGTVEGGESSRDTLELSERGWEVLTSTTGPDYATGAAMAYDEARKHTVLIGGSSNTETWIWNGTTWSTKTVGTQATPVDFGMLVYDVARQELVAFGGYEAAGGVIDETWTYNGTTWTLKTPATSPPVRQQPAAGYDRVNNKLILFGGNGDDGNFLDDTWSWDGTTWTKLDGGAKPVPSGVQPLMTWDPARRRLVLVSGNYFDAWEWDGTWWSPLGSIGVRENPSGAMIHPGFDGAGITVNGGYYFQTFETSGSWELRWDSDHASDLCRIRKEQDGDLLTACDDPDCWAVCTPACMPGDTCSSTDPRCGDSVCDPAESCRSCPADCTSCNNVCGDGSCETGETCAGECP